MKSAYDFYNDNKTPVQNMKAFARAHVKLALKAAVAKVKIVTVSSSGYPDQHRIDKDSILKSYTSKNIK